MKTRHARLSKLVPLAALLLASGLAHAAQPPRVMFVSGLDAKPVLIDPAGKETPMKKGQVIPPGFTLKVPAGATVQMMTEDKAIVAVRQNSLLKIEKLGDGDQPHRLKLDVGGLRVANSDKKPHKFEVDTPNAKIRFDRGDHEAYYFKEGNKITEGRWGTFGRTLKGESVLSTKDGDTRVDTTVVGYVPGAGKGGKPEVIDRIKTGDVLSNPVASKMQGASPVSDLNENQRVLGDTSTGGKPLATDTPVIVATPNRYALDPLKSPTPLLNGPSRPIVDPRIVAKLDPTTLQDPNKMRQLKVGTLPSGEKVVVDLRPQSVGIVSQDPAKSQTFRASDLKNLSSAAAGNAKAIQQVTCSGRSCF